MNWNIHSYNRKLFISIPIPQNITRSFIKFHLFLSKYIRLSDYRYASLHYIVSGLKQFRAELNIPHLWFKKSTNIHFKYVQLCKINLCTKKNKYISIYMDNPLYMHAPEISGLKCFRSLSIINYQNDHIHVLNSS